MKKKFLVTLLISIFLIILGSFIYNELFRPIKAKKETLLYLENKYNKKFKILSTTREQICSISEFSRYCVNGDTYSFKIKPIDNSVEKFDGQYNEISGLSYTKGVQENYIDTKKMMDITNELKPLALKYFEKLSNLSVNYEESQYCDIRVLKYRKINEFNNINISNIEYTTESNHYYGCGGLEIEILINEQITSDNLNEQVDLYKKFQNDVLMSSHQVIRFTKVKYNNDIEMSGGAHNISFYGKSTQTGVYVNETSFKDILY